ncbi:hypothetical protein GCM10025883_17000 [Mobilicoccus caccae]|uniref:Preprotein translocase subunit YajC n=2 Tax=Mobilicoccus caccae TaxID=1859295 RepID=A0ABQ6IP32_9MICO|nr:hypothetical protein GCM10025883_17000 [Mobilicoccus caccae]
MDSLLGLLPLLLLVALMIWMIVSQRRRQREVAQMQASLAVGDEVLTVGGIIGRLVSVEGPVLGLEVSPGVVVRVDRRTVSGRTSDVPAFGTTGLTDPTHDTTHEDTTGPTDDVRSDRPDTPRQD